MSASRRKLWSFFEALYSQELNETHAKSETPEWLKTPLLPHQQTAFYASLQLEQSKQEGIDVGNIAGDTLGGRFYTSHGILGDRVGSGKSLLALALVKAPAPPTNYTEYVVRGGVSYGDGRDVGLLRTRSQLRTHAGITLHPVDTCLFLIPHALVSQWEEYVSRDTTLKGLFIKKRQDALDPDFMEKISNYDAIFVSSTMYSTLRGSHPIRTILWKRIFMDEADSISIAMDMDELYGLFYWFISASWLNLIFASGAYFNITTMYPPLPETPPYVVSRIQALKGSENYLSILGCRHANIAKRMCGIATGNHTIALNAAGSQSARLIVHSSEEYIKKSFATPSITHTSIICQTPPNIRVLDNYIRPEMLERLHAGDVKGALDMLGMHAYSEEEITSAVTDSMQKELENAKKTLDYKKSIEYSSESAKQKAIETWEQKIASIENRITSIKDRIQRSSEQTCPICYSDVSNPAVTPCCQQLFCFQCMCESLKRASSCPLCRTRIDDIKNIKVVGNYIHPNPIDGVKKKTKQESLIDFLQSNPTAKVLMFSGYDATFMGLEHRLNEENIKYATVNGSQLRINKILRDFHTNKYQILFLNARNMGAGLNIISATHVVLFHKMPPELESQIIGRAMRLGRTEPLTVVHLLHENEIVGTV